MGPDLEDTEGEMQTLVQNLNTSARFIKFKIVEAYDDFVAIHHIHAEGKAL